ncbi:hypothetical protein PMAYCL1PPCAC_01753, partial [Pristionchus mayeri]
MPGLGPFTKIYTTISNNTLSVCASIMYNNVTFMKPHNAIDNPASVYASVPTTNSYTIFTWKMSPWPGTIQSPTYRTYSRLSSCSSEYWLFPLHFSSSFSSSKRSPATTVVPPLWQPSTTRMRSHDVCPTRFTILTEGEIECTF